jgi:D-arginine dehydrogenase
LRERGALHIAAAAGRTALAAMADEFSTKIALVSLAGDALRARIPGLRAGWDEGLFEPSCADIDVGALHAIYLAAGRRAGVRIVTGAALIRAERRTRGWRIGTAAGELEAAVLVNAAGAWADEVAARAGAAPLGIAPFRRTMVQLRIEPEAPAELPLVIDASGGFYFKPEAGGRIWLSPHDETPCPPCDSAPEEYDIALAVDRFEKVVDWRVVRVERSWAGLRSFAPDRVPVYGFAPASPGFFWFAGQGGFGIQTAPAAAKLAAASLLGTEPDPMVADIDPGPYRPDRFET